MNRYAKMLVFPALLAASCSNNQQQNNPAQASQPADTAKPITIHIPPPAPPDFKKERAVQNRYLRRMEAPSQYLVATAKEPSIVTGRQGTRITMAPKDMVTDEGQPVVEDIHVELKELSGTADFMQNNAPTVADGRLLVSGGAYYINVTSEGRQLRLKLGKTLQVNLPPQADAGMELFYGERGPDGRINWKEAGPQRVGNSAAKPAAYAANEEARDLLWDTATGNETLRGMRRGCEVGVGSFKRMVNLTDTMSAAAEKDMDHMDAITSGILSEVHLQQFGWINCDRFISGSTTSFAYTLDPKDSIVCGTAFLVFRDMNSMMEANYDCRVPGRFTNVPLNARATLIVVSVRGGKVYTAASDLTTGADKKLVLTMTESTESELRGLFGGS